MASVSVTTSLNNAYREIGILDGYLSDAATLDVKYQYFIGEVVLIRLFSILEGTIADVAFKLACGAPYVNARPPVVLSPCRSMQNAQDQMLTTGRRRALWKLTWTKADKIEDAIKFVLDVNDHYFRQITIHGADLNEMRIVRNHVAHRNTDTGRQFKNELQRIYGATPRITMGAFLMSTSRNRHRPSNLVRYVQTTKIILRDITSG